MIRQTNGYIKLHRKIREWDWYDDPSMLSLWVHLLLLANYEDAQWRGEDIPRGSLITSVTSLSHESGLSAMQIRRCLKLLKDNKQIEVNTTSKWTKITICNYDSYQSLCDSEQQTDNTQNNKQITNEEQQEKNNKKKEEDKEKELKEKEIVDRLYALYPASTFRWDKQRNVSTNKCEKDRVRIRGLLKTHTPEQIEYAITKYVEDTNGRNLKYFSTFLSNFPEHNEDKPQEQPKGLFTQEGETPEEREARLRAMGYQ